MTSILFVCMGNICRSPIAEGLLRQLFEVRGLAAQFSVDSAGTHAPTSRPPAPHAVTVAARYGADISQSRSRALIQEDYECFDEVLVMDYDNLDFVRATCPPAYAERVSLLLNYATETRFTEVPDPVGQKLKQFEFSGGLIAQAVEQLFFELTDQSPHLTTHEPAIARGK